MATKTTKRPSHPRTLPVLETGADVYREIKRRGLHLRHVNGRDNALLRELGARLGCPDRALARFLESTPISAADFLRAFVSVTEPFSAMFYEIWEYLSINAAPRAQETIRVRFGQQGERIDVSLEEFREWALTSRRVVQEQLHEVWSLPAIHGLFVVSEPFWSQAGRVPSWEPLPPLISGIGDDFERLVGRAYRLFSSAVSAHGEHEKQQSRKRALCELHESLEVDRLRLTQAGEIADLLPVWRWIFLHHTEIEAPRRSAAVRAFSERVEPELRTETTAVSARVYESLDILQLPFWRHRWHTYEIWVTITTLRALEPFRPLPRVVRDRIRLDGTKAEIIARLQSQDYRDACVMTQLETPFVQGRRQAIRPDVSVCFDTKRNPSSRALVIEAKQHQALAPAVMSRVARRYLDGSPRARGVILVNYDSVAWVKPRAGNIELITDMRPGTSAVDIFRSRVCDWTIASGLIPKFARIMVLLDVSESMKIPYRFPGTQLALSALHFCPLKRSPRRNPNKMRSLFTKQEIAT